MTDSRLIVDRTALERRVECEKCEGSGWTRHSPCDCSGGFVGVVLREFVVLGDAQLLVPCPIRTEPDGPAACTVYPQLVGECLDEGECDGTGLVPAPIGSIWRDVEIAERGYENFYDGIGEPDVEIVDVPFARVRTVHVVAREKVIACTSALCSRVAAPHIRRSALHLPRDLYAALPNGDPLYVLAGVTTL